MNGSWRIVLGFLIAGCGSGIASGLSAAVPPLGLVFPGVFFGNGISCAVHKSLTPLRFREQLALIGASTIGWFAAIFMSLVSMRIPGFDNGYIGGVLGGALGGGAGAFFVAFSLIIVVAELKPFSSLAAITFAGAIFGVLFAIVGIYISDHTPLGHPFDDLVSFPIWQAGVASSIPLFWDRPTASAPAG